MPPTRNNRNLFRKKSQLAKAPTGKQSNQRGLIRIIAGKHRGRRLPVLVSEGLRPTADRVKETLFNWLMMDIADARCLDLFAGSGSLGIEALSRGARHVCFVEQDPKVAKNIENNLTTLQETERSEILVGNAFMVEFTKKFAYEIVFVDPPFGQNLVTKSLELLTNSDCLAPNAFIYIEIGHKDTFELPDGFELKKDITTSQVSAQLFQYSSKSN